MAEPEAAAVVDTSPAEAQDATRDRGEVKEDDGADVKRALSKAMEEKEEGARLYKEKNWSGARASWLQALNELPSGDQDASVNTLLLSLHLNLTQVALQLQTYVEAGHHATLALKLDPDSSKAVFRRGLANEALGRVHQAAADFQRAARLEPRDAAIRRTYEDAKKKAAATAEADEALPPVHYLDKLPRAWFDVTVGDAEPRRITFALYHDSAPKTSENFRQLCTGEHQGRTDRGKLFSYKGCILHRMIPGLMVQGGDFENANGTGGESIYGRRFPDEILTEKHDRRGLLCMANDGPNTNGSNFFVTFAPADHLNKHHVCFGEVVGGEGFALLDALEQLPTDAECRPLTDCMIVGCGALPAPQAASSTTN